MSIDKKDILAWILFGVIICWFCLELGALRGIRKDIILQVGSLVFAILYGTFINLWNSKGFFYRGLDIKRGTFLVYPFVIGALMMYFLFYILINNKFGEELSFWWSLWALIGFILIIPLVNAMVLFTVPLRDKWHKQENPEDKEYLRKYRWGVLITALIIYVIIPVLFSA